MRHDLSSDTQKLLLAVLVNFPYLKTKEKEYYEMTLLFVCLYVYSMP
jgi:hypothetical protein